MTEPAEMYEPETIYPAARQEEGPLMVRWGRVAVFAGVVLLGFLLGRITAGGGASKDEVSSLNQKLASAQSEIDRLKASASASTGPQTLASPQPSPFPQASAAPTAAPSSQKTYVVQSGDTLASIAGKFYNDPSLGRFLATANQIDDPTKVRVGTKLVIPPKPSATASPGPVASATP